MLSYLSAGIIGVLFVVALVASGVLIFSRSSRLARARAARDDAPRPPWSASEWVSVGTAVVALLGAAGKCFSDVRSQVSASATAAGAVAARDSARRELTAYRDTVTGLVRFQPRTWILLPSLEARPGSGAVRVDDRFLRGDCDRAGATTTYDATGPARLRCEKGPVSLRLTAPSIILLVPDTGR